MGIKVKISSLDNKPMWCVYIRKSDGSEIEIGTFQSMFKMLEYIQSISG